jgi:alpha-beta hydrolase superfamily lysophospholipase
MPQHHYLKSSISTHGVKSEAFWAVRPRRIAIVFLHGFSGESMKTWVDFPSLAVADQRARGVDLLFFGYDGLFTQAGVSSMLFLNFMRALTVTPATIFPNFIGRERWPGYQHLVLVSHSLGAVIARRAIVDAIRAGDAWPDLARLVLFAPAHNGAYAAGLASSYLSSGQGWSLGGLASLLIRYKIPLFEDLKNDSTVIQSLKQDTAAEQAKAPRPSLTAHSVTWAQSENVVINAQFLSDPLPTVLQTNHSNVCKPNARFREPLDFVFAAV